MRKEVEPYLDALEKELEIEILGAWDTGSRARSLQTEGSDYDISLCFTQPRSNYVIEDNYMESIDNDASEFIQEPEDSAIPLDLVEFSGWDVKRFFELVRSYKPSAFDCFSSNLLYKQHPAFNSCSEYCFDNFHPIEGYNSFKNMAGYNYDTYLKDGDDTTIKRNLFVVESILKARYVQHVHEYPPLNFFVLLDMAPDEVFMEISKEEAETLAEQKLEGNGDESIGNRYEEEITSFLDYELDYENHIPDDTIESAELNEFIQAIIED
jgi:predicted nucleotidyltransferase